MMMTGVSRLFVDTNVLMYATDSQSPWHARATEVLTQARQQGLTLVISPQVLREYLAAMTRMSLTGKAPPLNQVLDNVGVFRAEFSVVEDNPLVLDALVELVRTVPVAGKQVHDTNIVATMQVHGVPHLLTHNTADFARFAHLITVVPLEPNPASST
jgi:predicted nucleic acid-binding protein